MHVDRQIAILGGWIAGPAFGVATMAAPDYFHLRPGLSGVLFWGGIAVFIGTMVVIAALSAREQEKRHRSMWPIVLMTLGVLIFGAGAAPFLWSSSSSASGDVGELSVIEPVNFYVGGDEDKTYYAKINAILNLRWTTERGGIVGGMRGPNRKWDCYRLFPSACCARR